MEFRTLLFTPMKRVILIRFTDLGIIISTITPSSAVDIEAVRSIL